MYISPLERCVQDNQEKLMFIAHLTKLLQEACQILDKLEVSVDVSEHLAHWWEHHKPKGETNEVPSDSGVIVPSGDRMVHSGSREGQDKVDFPEPDISKTSF